MNVIVWISLPEDFENGSNLRLSNIFLTFERIQLQFFCEGDGHSHVICLGSQATLLREELSGFVFESNRGTKHSFTAETSLGPEFAVGWGGKRSRKLRSKTDAARSKVRIFCTGS